MYRRETAGWFAREREKRERTRSFARSPVRSLAHSLRGGFQLVGRLCAPRSREQCGQDYLPPHSSPLLHRCVQQPGRRRLARAVLQPSFPRIPIVRFLVRPLQLSLHTLLVLRCAIESRIYPCRIFLGSLSSSPFGERRSSVPLFAGSLSAVLETLSSRPDPSCAVAFAFATNAIVLASLRPHLPDRCLSDLLRFTLRALILHPRLRSHGSIYESGRYGVSSTVIRLRRLIMAALLRP